MSCKGLFYRSYLLVAIARMSKFQLQHKGAKTELFAIKTT